MKEQKNQNQKQEAEETNSLNMFGSSEEKKHDFTPKKPEYKSSGVAVWVNNKGTNKESLTIKIVGHNTIFALKQI